MKIAENTEESALFKVQFQTLNNNINNDLKLLRTNRNGHREKWYSDVNNDIQCKAINRGIYGTHSYTYSFNVQANIRLLTESTVILTKYSFQIICKM